MLNLHPVLIPQVDNQTIRPQWIEEVLPKTFNLNIRARTYSNLIEVLQAQCLATKNLTNTTLFIVKNIQSSYVCENDKYYLKYKLHNNQIDILDFVNTHIPYFKDYKASLSAKKIKPLKDNIAEDIEGKDLIINKDTSKSPEPAKTKIKHEIELFTDKIDKHIYYQILNKTFLQFIVELYSKAQSLNLHNKKNSKTKPLLASDYEVCSSAMRRSAIHGVADNYQNYFKARIDYYKNPSKYKGMPQAPKYLAKRQGRTIEIIGQSIPANGCFVKMKNGQYLFTDYDKTTLLNVEQLSAYQEFSFNELLKQVKIRNNIDLKEKPVLMRIVPKGKRIKVEVIFNTVVKTKRDSVLGKTISFAKQDLYKDNTTNILSIKNKSLVNIFKDNVLPNYNINTLKMVGVDLGITNIAGIAYHTGQPVKGKIISNKDYEKRIKAYDIKLDNFKKNLSNKPVNEALEKSIKNRPLKQLLKTKLKEFDEAHKDSKLTKIELDNLRNEIIRNNPIQALTKPEIELLRLYNKTIYEHEKYRQLVTEKNNFVADCLHKLSHAMVQDFVRHNIELVFIGKNDGWKNKVNMGKATNRRFYNIPHAKLIQLLRYKCYEKGILVLTTEESYTSITSFINNVEVKEFEDKSNLGNIGHEELKSIKKDTNKSTTKEKYNYGGKRDKKNRHNYINDNLTNQSTELSLNKTEIGRIENNTTDLKNSIENIENGQTTPENGKKNENYYNVNAETNNIGLNKPQLLIIHADMNGSYNMIRKVIMNFKYDKTKHSRKNDIYTMFGKNSGLTKIQPRKVNAQVAPAAALLLDIVNNRTCSVDEVS